MKNAWFFKDLEFVEEDIVRNFIFHEENVTIPSITIDNDQDQEQISILNLVQEAIIDKDNILEPLVQHEETSRTNVIKEIHQ